MNGASKERACPSGGSEDGVRKVLTGKGRRRRRRRRRRRWRSALSILCIDTKIGFQPQG